MANSLTALNKEIWGAEMQEILEKELVVGKIANMELQEGLQSGDLIHRPYMTEMVVQDYTKGSDLSIKDITATDESLSIDQQKAVTFYVDLVDKLQNSYDIGLIQAQQAMRKLNRRIDANVLGEYANATSDVDDGNIGGTSGSNASINSSNVARLFSAAAKKLDALDVAASDRFAVISPSVLEYLRLYLGGKDSAFGEEVGRDGFIGARFGFEIYLSNNLTSGAVWTPANNPSDDDTISIAGVTITFKTTLSGGAGEVKIGAATANTLDNLVALLGDLNNDSSSSNYAAFSAANQAILDGISAADGATKITITWEGGGEVAYSGSESGDVWSAEVVHCLMGRKKAIDLVIQKQPSLSFNQEPKRPEGSMNVIAFVLYGFKTFTNMKDMLVDVNVDSSGF